MYSQQATKPNNQDMSSDIAQSTTGLGVYARKGLKSAKTPIAKAFIAMNFFSCGAAF